MNEELIKKLMKEAIQEELGSDRIGCQGCSAQVCKEKCDITPAEHARDHKDWQAFKDAMTRCSNVAQSAAVKSVISVLLIAVITGLYFLFNNFKQGR